MRLRMCIVNDPLKMICVPFSRLMLRRVSELRRGLQKLAFVV
jgi:hypothetical protein